MRKLAILISLVLAILAVPVAAQDDAAEATLEPGAAFVRIAHLASNVGPVDVEINGSVRSFGQGREFGSISEFTVVPAGDFSIEVTPSGRGSPIVEETTLTLLRNSYTTIAVIGNAQQGDIVPQVIDHGYEDISEFYGQVTVFHAIPDAPIIDVVLLEDDADPELLLGRIGYPGSILLEDGTTNDGVASIIVLADTYDLAVVPNGQTGPVVLDLSDTTIEGDTFYFVAAYGTLDDPQVAVQTFTLPED